MNGRGNPFADPFGEFIMPTTRSEKELADFFSAMPAMEFTNDIKSRYEKGGRML
jgi:hypothetical protein